MSSKVIIDGYGGKPTPHEQDQAYNKPWILHGEEGHTGYRCGKCADDSGVTFRATNHSVDHWQNLQIDWQQECDVIMLSFDEAVAAHFPNHLPSNCQFCPSKPILPEKPDQPFERALRQSSS